MTTSFRSGRKLLPEIETERQGKVRMDAAFVEFVEDDNRDALEPRVGLEAAGKNAFGHHFDPGACRHFGVEPDGVADRFTRLFAETLRHPAGRGDRGYPARFKHDDAASLRQDVKKRKRHAGRFAGSGRRVENDGVVLCDCLFQLGENGVDRKGELHDYASPLPRWEGLGRVNDASSILSSYCLNMLQHFMVPETKHNKALSFQPSIAFFILGTVVHYVALRRFPTINFFSKETKSTI